MQADIFNIEDFSIDDGPGIRTVIFFKGCTLRCRWCHNPESIDRRPVILIYEEKCIGCGECFRNCPQQAHEILDGRHVINTDKCVRCMTCVQGCYAEVLVRAGESMDTDEIFHKILTNREYFARSGGGVTFSGGECMVQKDALLDLLKRCNEEGIHTAVDTAGNIPWEWYEEVLPYSDLFLYDLKAFDPEVHRKCTGVDNELILSNFRKLIGAGAQIRVRIPYIPGWNDGELPAIAQFLKEYPQVRAELLGYHTLGVSKYKALRQEYIEARVPSTAEVDELKARYGFM